MSVQKVSKMMIGSLSSSKLTGALPAVDGSALLNVPSFIKNASDPATDSNPSDGLGTIWVNTTSGEMFSLTDATTDENVWTNIGSGSGDIQKFDYRGESFGYNSGGSRGAPPTTIIDKQSFTSDGNATDVADLTQGRHSPAGTHSSTHSYAMGGLTPSQVDTIDKFPFASETNATDVGNLSVAKAQARGQSNDTYIYCSGGYNGPSIELNHVEKRITSSDGDMTNVLSLTVARRPTAEASSETEGFNAGGEGDGAANVTVDKFSFANDNDATDHGDLLFTHADASGGQSDTHGFSAGGHSVRTIQRYAFSSNTTATDWGDLLNNSSSLAGGTSSLSHVYMAGGVPSGSVNVIQKYATSTPSNATDVGDLTVGGYSFASSQI